MNNKLSIGDAREELLESVIPPDYQIVERAYMVIDVINSTPVCTGAPDIEGYSHLRSYLDDMCRAVRDNGGDIVKTIGDGLEACFIEPNAAFSAGMGFLQSPILTQKSQFAGVRIGLGFGNLIRYSIDGQIDYFGREVILASRMASYGSQCGLIISARFWEEINSSENYRLPNLVPELVQFKGLRASEIVYVLPFGDCAKFVPKLVV